MVTSVPSTTTFTITMDTAESGTPLSSAGSASVKIYYKCRTITTIRWFWLGHRFMVWYVLGAATTTLATSIINDTVTTIPLTNTAAFPSSGEIRIGSEDISFTNNNTTTNILSGGAREVNGTPNQGTVQRVQQ